MEITTSITWIVMVLIATLWHHVPPALGHTRDSPPPLHLQAPAVAQPMHQLPWTTVQTIPWTSASAVPWAITRTVPRTGAHAVARPVQPVPWTMTHTVPWTAASVVPWATARTVPRTWAQSVPSTGACPSLQ
jgi:hypothetical protein